MILGVIAYRGFFMYDFNYDILIKCLDYIQLLLKNYNFQGLHLHLSFPLYFLKSYA